MEIDEQRERMLIYTYSILLTVWARQQETYNLSNLTVLLLIVHRTAT